MSGGALRVCSRHCQPGQGRRPLTGLLDRCGVFQARLFLASCVSHQGCYFRDLSRLGRGLSRMLTLDSWPASYSFHPENAVPVQSWFDDMADTELLNPIPIFEGLRMYTSFRQLRSPVAFPPTLCLYDQPDRPSRRWSTSPNQAWKECGGTGKSTGAR